MNKMEELRCMYELPYMAHFLRSKKEQFKFIDVDIRSFEASILDSESKLFDDIVCHLLRHIKQNKDIKIATCQQHLKAFAEENKSDFSQMVKEEIKSITAADKLRILKRLADLTKDRKNDLDELLNQEFGTDGNDPTVINVGQDSENRTYWYFDDLRLYRRKNGQAITNCDWQCLATTCETWEEIINRFSQSKDEQEQELYSYLDNHIYPAIKQMLEAQPSEAKIYTNQEIESREQLEMDGKMTTNSSDDNKPQTPATTTSVTVMDQSELIKSENPELTKVLSEEPSSSKPSARNAALTSGNDNKKTSGMPSFTQQQQQNQLFVFSTMVANNAADSVKTGAHSSIYLYHYDDPKTKNFVQASQMKVTIPTSQSKLPMLPQRATNPYRHSRAAPAASNGQQQAPLQWNSMRSSMPSNTHNQSMMSRQPHMAGSPCGPMPGYMSNDMKNPMAASSMQQPDISHKIVPNENLTPDQLQRRETGLASLRKIHQMLLAEENDPQSQSTTDFSHINMAQDRQGPFVPPSSQTFSSFPNYRMNPSMNGAAGPMFGPGTPMSPAGNPAMMESKPPPPYPMPSPGTVSQPAPKKVNRKRKTSTVQSPSPSSPMDQPSIKAEKQSIPPSPLAAQSAGAQNIINQVGAHSGATRTPQQNNSKPEEVMAATNQRVATQQQLARQHSLPPNFPHSRNGAPTSGPSYRMLQAGQPTPYQNSAFSGPNDAPPSYNSLRRGMSIESMTAPPSQRQQYLQPENQERVIEKQLNASHQSAQPDQQSAFSNPSSAGQSTPGSFTSVAESANPLTNITSASLADLAKGMEQNISEMSQKMSQGGPYGDMQSSTANPEGNSEQTNTMPPPTSTAASTNNQQQPSVNNTFVNTHMSIGQVNIQNVTANQTYQGPGMQTHMQQNVDVSMNTFAGGVPQGPQPDPMYKPPQQSAPAVSIQNKGRNTIQYLPVSQPSITPSHDTAIPPKPTFDFIPPERFPVSNAAPTNSFFHGDNQPLTMATGGPPARHPVSSIYGGAIPPHSVQPGGGHMMTTGVPPGLHMTDNNYPRPAVQPAHYMMSAQQTSMSMGYSQAPAPTAGHPGMVESHMHMRSQHMMMSGPSYPAAHPAMPPNAYNPPPSGYTSSPTVNPSNMPYGGAGDYMTPAGVHPMPTRAPPPMQQSMMISHQGAPYMANPPYM